MSRFTHKICAIWGSTVLLMACSDSAPLRSPTSILPLPVTIYAPTATPTLSATATISVTATVLPTPIPTMPVVNVGQIAVKHDLLFIQDDRLMRWKSASNEVEVLLGDDPVWDYVLTADQKHAAVGLRQQGKDVLGMYHFESKTLDILTPITRVWPTQWFPWDRHWFKPSPDGRWVAYYVSDDHGATGKLMLHSTLMSESTQPNEIGFCGRPSPDDPYLSPACNDFIWIPDSKGLLWSDGMADWSAAIGQPPIQLRASELAKPDAIQRGWIRRYIAWSPNQHFLLAEINACCYEGSWQAVVGVVAGQIFLIPDTFAYTHIGGQSIWRDDNTALSLSLADQSLVLRQFDTATFTESAKLQPNHAITYSDVLTPTSVDGIALNHDSQLNAIIYAGTDYESSWRRYLYRFNVAKANPKPAIALPAELASYSYLNITWSPNAQVALIFDELDVGLYLISTTDEAAVKLSSMLNGKEPPHRFEWLR